MIQDWILAFVTLFGGIIVIMVMLPVYNQLFPFIQSSFSNSGLLLLLLSGAVLLMIGGLIYNFVVDSSPEQYGGDVGV